MNDKIIIFLVSLMILIFSLMGCLSPQEYTETAVLSDVAGEPVLAGDKAVATRFQESAPQSPTAVESAIELSEKYAKLSEEAAALRQKNQNLLTESQQHKEQIANYDAQLRQTQKELTEANNLLIDMRVELNSWKTDILGFREEMRQADTEQLRALINILEMLGGEFKIEPVKSEGNPQASKTNVTNAEDVSSTIVSLNKPGQKELKEQETPTSGEQE